MGGILCTGGCFMDKKKENINHTDKNCCKRHTWRNDEEKKRLLSRLRRIEGQIRGLEKMVENDAYCPDILMQSSAAACAIHSFNRQLLEAHIRGCVTEEIREGGEGKVDELCNMLQKLMK